MNQEENENYINKKCEREREKIELDEKIYFHSGSQICEPFCWCAKNNVKIQLENLFILLLSFTFLVSFFITIFVKLYAQYARLQNVSHTFLVCANN